MNDFSLRLIIVTCAVLILGCTILIIEGRIAQLDDRIDRLEERIAGGASVTVIVPLVVMSMLIVGWAILMPPLPTPQPSFRRIVIPHAVVENATISMGVLTVAFRVVSEASEEASRSIQLFGEAWSLVDPSDSILSPLKRR